MLTCCLTGAFRWLTLTTMGTWGVGLFDNDLAADMRSDWDEALSERESYDEAMKRLTDKYAGRADDSDEGPVYWFAIAALELDARGEVNALSRDRALSAIASDLERWRLEGSPEDRQAREQILADFAERLNRAKTARSPL